MRTPATERAMGSATRRPSWFVGVLLAMAMLAALVGGGMPAPEQPQTAGGVGLIKAAEGVVGESALGVKRPGGDDWADAAPGQALGGAESADAGGRTSDWEATGAAAAEGADATAELTGRLLQTVDGLPGNGTNGTDSTGAGAGGEVDHGPALNFTKICTEQVYPAQYPECLAMLQAKCENSNYTLPLCAERGMDECSRDNGGCGDPQYITCSVHTWVSWSTQTANLTMVRVPRNWTDGTGLSEGANVTEWETIDITFEENQTKIDALFAAQGEVLYTLGEVPLAIPNREQRCLILTSVWPTTVGAAILSTLAAKTSTLDPHAAGISTSASKTTAGAATRFSPGASTMRITTKRISL